MRQRKRLTALCLAFCLVAWFPAGTQAAGLTEAGRNMAEAAAAGPSAGGGRILAAIIGPSAESPGLSGPQGPGVSENTALVIPEDVPRPQIQSEGAVVIDGATGAVIYGKNENSRFYPASTTKLMTALLVLERTDLKDMVTFSKGATTNLEAGASTLNLTEGDRLTVEQCLYGLLLKSANEIGNALAEHVSGSVSGFAALMNEKAVQLGCKGTHFTNPHGLNDSEHYTTPYDMALIGRAAFQNETLCKIDTTTSYRFPATKNEESKTISMGHKMLYSTDSRYYEGIIGGKTGYTSLAGNTLVTGAERNGVRLVAVVMKSRSTHYEDTKALLDYGFAVMEKAGAQQTGSVRNPSEGQQAGPGGVPEHKTGWERDGGGWYYIKDKGVRAAGEWLKVDGVDYWIDPDGYMATGWREFTNGSWYYFKDSGAMAADEWAADNGKWFYLGSQGAMLTGVRTPDGYELGADGAWIP